MKNKFNIGEIIKSNRGTKTKTIHALITDIYPSSIIYKVIYLHDGTEGSLGFSYAHNYYTLATERANE